MALNFPDPATQTPVNTFSPTSTPDASTNGITYLWDGTKWNAQTNGDAAFWQRVGTTLSPATVGDNISTTGDLTTADATVDTLTSNGLVDAPDGTFSGDVQVGSLNSGPLAGLRNQLINGDFRTWQRGVTFPGASTGQFTADRWYAQSNSIVGNDGSQFLRAAQEPGNGLPGFSYAYHPTGVSQNLLHQPIETNNYNQPYAAGTTWTVSWYEAQGAVDAATIAFANDHTNTGAVNPVTGSPGSHNLITSAIDVETIGVWKRRSSTFTISANGTVDPSVNRVCLNLVIGCTTASNYMTGIQLEPGPVATPFEHRPIGLELSLCQRYFFLASNKYTYWRGDIQNGKGYGINAQFPTEMRAAPTISNITTSQENSMGSASQVGSASAQSANFSATATSTGSNGSISVGFNADAEL